MDDKIHGEWNWEHIFDLAMKRYQNRFRNYRHDGGIYLNLGSGKAPMPGADNLDLPEWSAEGGLYSYGSGEVCEIYAMHFFEHLDPKTLKYTLEECARVLRPRGLLTYCVPYAMSPIAFMDIDHKTFWTEETMRTLINPRGYDSGIDRSERFDMIVQYIAGVDSQNLAVIGQLQKMGS